MNNKITCTKCKQLKNRDHFHNEKLAPNGKQSRCILCNTKGANEWNHEFRGNKPKTHTRGFSSRESFRWYWRMLKRDKLLGALTIALTVIIALSFTLTLLIT